MNEIQSLFIENLKRCRSRLGLSQQKLAELCSLSPSYIGELEIGRKFPSAETLSRFASVLKVRPYELFLSDEDRNAGALPERLSRCGEELKRRIAELVDEAVTRYS